MPAWLPSSAMGTFCPQLRDGCYIDRTGEVYACCTMRSVSYGNIHEASLRELVNRPPVRQARRESLSGTLSCYTLCNLFDKTAKSSSAELATVVGYAQLRRLHISFGQACNIHCVMCNHPEVHNRNPIVLGARVVIDRVEITPFTTIVLQGGEPLYVPECLEYMSYLEATSKPYTILTNGLLIDDAMAQRLARHAACVKVSLNGASAIGHEAVNRGSSFRRVVGNVVRLHEARSQLRTEMILMGHMTITTENIVEVPQFIRSLNWLGFDRVDFGYVKETVPLYLAANPGFRDDLCREVMNAIAEVGPSRVDPLRLAMIGLFDEPASSQPLGQLRSAPPPVVGTRSFWSGPI